MAWLEERASQPASYLERLRAAELLVALVEGGLFRPLTYVHWLVARGILPGTANSSALINDQRAWHR